MSIGALRLCDNNHSNLRTVHQRNRYHAMLWAMTTSNSLSSRICQPETTDSPPWTLTRTLKSAGSFRAKEQAESPCLGQVDEMYTWAVQRRKRLGMKWKHATQRLSQTVSSMRWSPIRSLLPVPPAVPAKRHKGTCLTGRASRESGEVLSRASSHVDGPSRNWDTVICTPGARMLFRIC